MLSLGISQVMNLRCSCSPGALLAQTPTPGGLGDATRAQSTREEFGDNAGRDLSLCLILTCCHKFIGCLFHSNIGGDKKQIFTWRKLIELFLPKQMREKERIWKTKAKFQYCSFSKQNFSFGIGRNTHANI